jgi:hypothetical protein
MGRSYLRSWQAAGESACCWSQLHKLYINTAMLTAPYLCHGPWNDAPVVWVAKHGVGLAAACLAVSKDAHLRPASSSTAQLSATSVSVA